MPTHRRHPHTLLLDLPNEEPWYELKFQLRELEVGTRQLLEVTERLNPLLGQAKEALQFPGELRQFYFAVDHSAYAHAPRAVQLASCLLTMPPEQVPEWDVDEGHGDFAIPEEILSCRSLPEAQSKLISHLQGASAALQQANDAVRKAAEVRGTLRDVLEQVLQYATTCRDLLQEAAWPQAQGAWRWSVPYWRLTDPEGAAAYDERVARLDAEVEAELVALGPVEDAPGEE